MTDELDDVKNNIEIRRKSRVESTDMFNDDFIVNEQEASIALQKKVSEKPVLDKLSSGASAAVEISGVGAIGEELGESAALAKIAIDNDETLGVIIEEALQRGESRVDPNWKPSENDEQWGMVQAQIDRLGVDIQSTEAESLTKADSLEELNFIADEIERTQTKMREVAESGVVGQAAMLATGFADVDALLGVGIFNKMSKARLATQTSKLVKNGKLTVQEADALMSAGSRLDNIRTGAIAGTGSAVVVEGTRATLEPDTDVRDVMMGTLVGAGLGAGIGSVIRTRSINDTANDLMLNRMAEQSAKQDVPLKQHKTFSKAMSFTEKAEGGLANVSGDRGGFTAMGISSKSFPKQAAEAASILKEKGVQAARKYTRDFFKKEFWDKVVSKDMTPEQATVMFDTAIHSGIGKAKELFKKTGGDVNKFLDLREQFLADIVKKDPTQEKFAQGWLNRINNLRSEVTTQKTPEFKPDESVGAAKVDREDEVYISESAGKIQQAAYDWEYENPELASQFDTLGQFVTEGDTVTQRLTKQLGERFYAGLQKTPFISDYDALVKEGGVVGRMLAHKLLESPVGQIVNNRSADVVADMLQRDAAVLYAPNAPAHYKAWRQDQGIKTVSKRNFLNGQTEFGAEIRKYRETIHAGREPDWEVHPSVKAASEEMDMALKTSLANTKKYKVEGYEDVQFEAGYTPRKWNGTKLKQIEYMPGIGTKAIIDSFKDAIRAKHPDAEDVLIDVYANALYRGVSNSRVGTPSTGLRSITGDDRSMLEDTVASMGIAEKLGKSPKEIVDKMLLKDRSIQRINLDMTTPIRGTDKTLLDVSDDDLYALMDGTIREQANLAGMASTGIQQSDKDAWMKAILDEADFLGTDGVKAARMVDNIFSYFGGGAYAGGAGAAAGRINKLAILSFLPQLGITQIAEAGVAMGVSGVNAYTKYAKKSIKQMLRDKDHEVLDSLFAVNKYVGDHREFVRTNHLDDADLTTGNKLLRTVDAAMDQGLRGMGYVSGFYKVNEFLQMTAALSMNNYMVKSIVNGKNSTRLKSMGVDDEFRAIIQDKLDRDVIDFDSDGDVLDMHPEQWRPDEIELLRAVTRRNMDQTVQKARRGEAHAWQYTQLGSMLTSLRSFTFLAAQKQLIRNMRHADGEAMQTVLYTLLTASLAYAGKQVVNGKDENLTTERIVQGALGWSPMLSPVMMAADPLAYMIGADKIPGSPLPFNEWRYGHQGLIGLPPGVAAMNQLGNLPRVPLDLLEGDGLDRESINALKSVPFGRSYPMVPIMEALEE